MCAHVDLDRLRDFRHESRQIPLRESGTEGRNESLCCGRRMEHRLAQARDREGQVVFVSVCVCPRCRRLVLDR